MITSAEKLPKLLARIFNINRVPMIHGSPGVGKSAIIAEFARDNNLKLIDVRLSQRTPTSLNGFGRINNGTNKSEFIPFSDFPLEGEPIPKGYDGYLLFLDEITSASLQVQAATYQLTLDKEIGSKKLHPECYVVCAGNKSTDGAIVNRMGTASQSRMIHLELEADKDSWLAYADRTNLDYRITAYVNFKPSIINSFKPDHKDLTFTCGRTLEFASELIKDVTELGEDDLILLSGTLGEGNAKEFYGFCSVFKELPSLKEIIANPEGATLKEEPNFMFGVSSFVGENMNESNIEQLIKYLLRFRPEFQAITAQKAYRGNPALISNPHLIKWVDSVSLYF
jgi:hypothetical protein|tara:strand:+ start:2898 stop:3914 length:1017 start_codon:yes stop_codon:yes gene_type:complete